MNFGNDLQSIAKLYKSDKLDHGYIKIYDSYFKEIKDKELKILEIGVADGKSLLTWSDYFKNSVIIGIDIHKIDIIEKNLDRKNIKIHQGSQSDEKFINDIINQYGNFDIIIDDGSHQVAHVNKTFQYLYPKMSKNGVYLVEDTHAAYWKDTHGGGLNEPESIVNVSKNLVDKLNADHTKGQVEPDDFTRSTQSITFYDSVIVFERGEIHWKQPLEFGRNQGGGSSDNTPFVPASRPVDEKAGVEQFVDGDVLTIKT